MDILITGLSAVTGLGGNLAEHERKINTAQTALRPLSGLIGDDTPYSQLNGSWIEDRSILNSRKWAPASALSIHVAKQAVLDAGLLPDDLTHAAVIAGSSRGNAAGWVSPWEGRRPFKLMAASNSMHGEIGSAVSIELGIQGPWQTIASACSASLDALGMAWMMLKQGIVKRAIVTGVELPLIPEIMKMYTDTGVLSLNGVNDPYSPDATGFFPGEAGSAMVLETSESFAQRCSIQEAAYPGGHISSDSIAQLQLTGYWCNSDAASPIGMPENGEGLSRCVQQALDSLKKENQPAVKAVCPHASGTLLHGKAELAALGHVFSDVSPVSIHPLKPYLGHTVGASGLLESVITAHYMRQQKLPPNLPTLTPPGKPFAFSADSLEDEPSTVLKIAVGMGGHNSIVAIRSL